MFKANTKMLQLRAPERILTFSFNILSYSEFIAFNGCYNIAKKEKEILQVTNRSNHSV